MAEARVDITDYGFSILQIETISSCNMKCKFCPYPLRKDKGKRLSDDNILKIIDSLQFNNNLEYICFSHFNEPLLDERIYRFIAYTKNKGFPVMIITNGLLFEKEDIINSLIQSNPDYIKISLQTASEKLFRNSRGITKMSFNDYKNNLFRFLKRAHNSSCHITIDLACNFLSGLRYAKTVLLGLEKGDPSVYNTVNELRADVYSFLIDLQYYDRRFVFDKKRLNKYLQKVEPHYLLEDGFMLTERIFLKIKPFTQGNRLTQFYPVKKSKGCSNRILGILGDGTVVPCCLAYDSTLSLGNIQIDSLKHILAKKASFLKCIRQGYNLPLICRRCMGAPTQRGAFIKSLKNTFLKNDKLL